MWNTPGDYHISNLSRKFHERIPGPWFNIKMSSYQYRKSHCGDKTILRPSYLHNGISYTGKTTSLYWIGALISTKLSRILPDVNSASGESPRTFSSVQKNSCWFPVSHKFPRISPIQLQSIDQRLTRILCVIPIIYKNSQFLYL